MGKYVGHRVSVTLPLEVKAVLDRIKAVTSVGAASFIREMLVDSLPMLDAMALSLEQAQASDLNAFKTLVTALEGARAGADQLTLNIKKKHRRMVRSRKK
jgi:hypothetical protein